MLCRNKEVWPNTHTHQTVEESRRCWAGQAPAPAAPLAAPPPPPPVQTVAPQGFVDPASKRQLDYIRDLGGDMLHAVNLSHREASEYIDELLAKQRRERSTRTADPRLDVLKGMLDMVPNGYYATAPQGEGGHIDFIRVSRPDRGKWNGCVKIQTQHSDKWSEALVLYPSGKWWVRKPSAIEMMFLVMADTKTCRLRYSIEVQACGNCNKTLTDDRSRHYLIGPDCEKKYHLQDAIAEVDDKNDGMSFEELVARGLPTRVWQEKELANA